MKLIVGLGNIGNKYLKTRHNIGFMVVDKIADRLELEFENKKKLKGQIAKGDELVLLKPSTMMNLSGEATQATVNFFGIDIEDVIVIHDELDISFGKTKVKQGGSDGSHNGLSSVTQHIGPDYQRVRVGIDRQPRVMEQGSDFVLSGFAKDETERLDELIDDVINKHILTLL